MSQALAVHAVPAGSARLAGPSAAVPRPAASPEDLEPLDFSLNVSVVGGGSVVKTPDLVGYENGDTVALTAVPDSGHRFTGWSADLTGASNPVTIIMNRDATVIAHFTATGPRTWVGATAGGDGSSWNDPNNWSEGIVPDRFTGVFLDHSAVTTNYTVNLPGGVNMVWIQRLVITPDAGKTITLALPAGSTADPGLRVTDGDSTGDDVVLRAGAVLRNLSGAITGVGVQVDGTMRIEGGARYVHSTRLSASDLSSRLAQGAGTETGEFEYDVPGATSYAISGSGRTYGNLTLSRTLGSTTYTASGSSPLTVRGGLALRPGVSFASSMSGDLLLAGNLTNQGSSMALPFQQRVIFNGTTLQRITGSSAVTIGGPSTIETASTLAIGDVAFSNNGAMTVRGALQIDPGSLPGGLGSYSYNASTGTLIYNRSSIQSVGNDPYWPSANGPPRVVVRGAGIAMNVFRTVPGSLDLYAPVNVADRLTVSGTASLYAGGAVGASPVYAGNGTLVYRTGVAVGPEWAEGDSMGPGVPRHVSIDAGAGNVTMPTTDRTVPGDLTLLSGTVSLNPEFAALKLLGNLAASVPFVQSNGEISFQGSATQTISGTGAVTLPRVQLAKQGGSVKLLSDITCAPGTGDALEFSGTTDILDLNGRTLTLMGSVLGMSANRGFKGSAGSSLALSGSGVAGTLWFAAGGRQLGGFTLNLGASGMVTVATPLTVSGTLTLLSGRLATSDTLVIAPGGSVFRSSGYVVGHLRKSVNAGATSAVFEVGSANAYAPITLAFSYLSVGGAITASTTGSDHPNIGTSGLVVSPRVHRYWTLAKWGAVFDSCRATFRFAATDVDSGADPLTFLVRRYQAGAWSGPKVGILTATSTEAIELTDFGDFAVGPPSGFSLTTMGASDIRYAMEVSFPSTPNQRVIVNESVNAMLGNLDPVQLAGRTIAVYRDGQVVLEGAPSGPIVAEETTRQRVTPEAGAVPEARFVIKIPGPPPYLNGTLPPAYGDPDNDGDRDLVLYRNDGDANFSEVPGVRTLLAGGNYHGAAWADYDQDGFQDAVIMGYSPTSTRTALLRNLGNGTFTNVAPALGIDLIGFGETPVWGDFDGDGWQDLFAPYYAHAAPFQSFLYHNNGDGTFTDVSDSAGVAMRDLPEALKPEGATAGDWDNDGDLDLYCASHFFRNDGTGRFTDILMQVGLTPRFDEGCVFVDYDNDGDFDMYFRNTDNPRLFRNDAGQLVDVTTPSGLFISTFFWGDTWGDLDNDGDLDLLQFVRNAPARLMLNQGDGTFRSDSAFANQNIQDGMSALADIDRDGDLDLALGAQPVRIFTNRLNLEQGYQNSFLRVRVLDANGRETQHGATVRLRAMTGPYGIYQTRDVGGGASYLAHNEYTAHFGTPAGGVVARSPDQSAYPLETPVQLTATPQPHYHFVNWAGDVSGTANPVTVIMNGERVVRANFAIDTYPLSVSAIGNGTVVRNPEQANYPYGSRIPVTAVPAVGYHLVGWSGDASGTANPVTVTVNGSRSVTATFAINTYTLNVGTVGNGAVTRNPDQPSYNHGTVVEVTAVPGPNYVFTGWSGDTSGTTNPLNVVMNRSLNITANFALVSYSLGVTVVGNGSVTKSPNQASYPHGSIVQLTATPDPGNQFVGWSGDAVGSTNPITVLMDGSKNVTATFAINTYTLNVAVIGNGAVTKNPNQASYPHGSSVVLTANATPGHEFVRWTGDVQPGEETNPLTVLMDANKSITGEFTFSLAVSTVGQGTVAKAPDLPAYAPGDTVVLTASPGTGYHFDSWSGDSTGSTNPLTVVMTGNMNIVATFVASTYTLTTPVVGSGTVTKNPDQPTYAHGTSVQLTATPDPGNHFVGWSGDAVGSTNPITVLMDGPKNVTATFAINTYTLATSAVGSGTLTKNPDQSSYDHGTSVQLTATPDTGYRFAGWSGDTSGLTNPLTLVMTADRNVVGNFELNVLRKWLGGGDGTTWASAANWFGGVVPTAADTVVLDQTYVSANYTVNLPSGATTVTLTRLLVTPAAGRTITLVLPSANTANPGLRVGDATAGTTDIQLGAGAVLRNSSGASSGSGIETNSPSNGIVVIENGARYIHNTVRSADPVVSQLASGTGTENGVFEYDVPTGSSFAIAASNRTYGSLTLTRSSGSASYTASGSNAFAVRGDFTINANVTYSSSMSGTMTLGGDLINLGSSQQFPGSQPVVFSGPGPQSVGGTSQVTMNGPVTVSAGATLVTGQARFTASGSVSVNGAFQIDPGIVPDGSGTFTYGPANGTLICNTATQLAIGSNSLFWPTSNGPPHVTVLGGGLTMNANRSVTGTFRTSANVSRANRITLSGTAQLDPGGSFTLGAPLYSGSATLVYNGGFTVGIEWSAGTSVGSGVPRNVVVRAGSDSVRMPAQDRTAPGDLTIETGTLTLSPTAGDLTVGGNVAVAGALRSNGRFVVFKSAVTQDLSAASGTLDRLRIEKTAGSVRLLGNLACLAPEGGNSLEFTGTTDVLDLNGQTLRLGGAILGSNPNGGLRGTSSSNLIVEGSGPMGTLRFATGGQMLGNLTVNRSSSGSVNLGTQLAVQGTLTLTAGRVVTGSNLLVIAGGGTVLRTSGLVEGRLRKTVPTGPSALTFEVGTGTSYAPVDIQFGNVTATGNLTASTTAGDHPNLQTSGLSSSESVNRYWTVTSAGGIAFDQYTATLGFVAADLDTGVDTNSLVVRKFDTSVWSVTTTGTRTPTSIQATGLTSFSDFAVGEVATYALNVSALGHGAVTKNPDRPTYDAGSSVTLTATPDSGHAFVRWSGDASGSTNPLTLVMDANKVVTAVFTRSLTVSVVGNGTVTKSPNQTVYASGDTVTLTANPAAGHHLVGWSGDASGSANPLLLVMDADKSVTATFAINTYTLAVSVNGTGTLFKVPDQPTYDHGTSVQLTVIPGAGYHFVGWDGDTSGTANPLTIVMTRPRSIIAIFAINTYPLTVTVVGGGVVAKSPDQASYDHGTAVQLTATADTGYNFVSWSGDATGGTNPTTVVMNGPRSVTATFALSTYPLTVTVAGNGSVAKNPDQATYDHGATVTLTATAAAGNHFVGWSGDTSGSTNPLTVVMTRARSITANFSINSYALTVSVVGNGSVTKNPDQALYDHGTDVTLTAAPFSGYTFMGWSGDTSASASPLVVRMDKPRSITATFMDVDPPQVRVVAPNGGEALTTGSHWLIRWDGDSTGVAGIDILLSRTGATGTFSPIVLDQVNDGSFDWLVTGPVTNNAFIQVVARDSAGNSGNDKSDLAFTISSQVAASESPITEFALGMVGPIPTRGDLFVEYAVPRDAPVRLRLVDLQGRQVAELADGLHPRGRYTARWNGRNSRTAMAPGVYFLRFEVPGRSWVRRIVLTY